MNKIIGCIKTDNWVGVHIIKNGIEYYTSGLILFKVNEDRKSKTQPIEYNNQLTLDTLTRLKNNYQYDKDLDILIGLVS